MIKLFNRQKKEQSPKEEVMQYIETNTVKRDISRQQKQQDIQLPVLLRSCKEVSIDSFIQAYCNQDYKGLILKGDPDMNEVLKAWDEVLFEYSSLIKTENSQYFFETEKQMSLLKWHINYVDNAIRFLRIRYDEDLVKELNALGYDGDFNKPEVLDRTISLAKTQIFELDTLNDEYNRMRKTAAGKAQTEEEFISTVVMLSKYQNYHIDEFTTSVYRFTIIFNNYLAEGKALQRAS